MSSSVKNAPNEKDVARTGSGRMVSKSQISKNQNESKSKQKPREVRPHVPKLFYCLNGHLKDIVDTAIQKTGMYSYEPEKAIEFTENLSVEIGLTLKGRDGRDGRFRFVVLVTIMQKNEQSAVCKMGFLWDSTQDHWNNYVFDCRTFQLNASVLCVYSD